MALHRCALLVQKLTKCFHHWFPKHLIINYSTAPLDPRVICLYLCHRKGYMMGNSRQKLSTELITNKKQMSLVSGVCGHLHNIFNRITYMGAKYFKNYWTYVNQSLIIYTVLLFKCKFGPRECYIDTSHFHTFQNHWDILFFFVSCLYNRDAILAS